MAFMPNLGRSVTKRQGPGNESPEGYAPEARSKRRTIHRETAKKPKRLFGRPMSSRR